MSPVFAARRRAEEFHSLVEGTSTDGLHDARYADLLALVTDLRDAPAVEARTAFVADLRARLLVAAETTLARDTDQQLAARRAPAARRTARERRVAALVGGFAIVSATASMAVAAQTALPGDTLYPLKRAIENAHAGVLTDADDKGSTLLDNATGRLEEVDELSRDPGQAAMITQTLDDFSAQASEASELLLDDYADNGRASTIEELRTFTADSMDSLTRLESVVPVESRDSLMEAARLLTDIDQLARAACPACVGADLFAVPTLLRGSTAPILGSLTGSGEDASASAPTTPPGDSPRRPVPRPGGSDDPRPTQAPTGRPDQAPTEGVEDPVLPEQPPAGGGGNPEVPVKNPIEDITDGLLGGGNGGGGAGGGTGSTTSGGSGLGDLLDPVTGTVDDVVGGLGG